jgi:hypothetical protein
MTTFYVQHSAGHSVIAVNNVLLGEADAPKDSQALASYAFNITTRYNGTPECSRSCIIDSLPAVPFSVS